MLDYLVRPPHTLLHHVTITGSYSIIAYDLVIRLAETQKYVEQSNTCVPAN